MDPVQGVSSLGTSITSPAKLVFVGYVLLAYIGKLETSTGQFLSVAVIFFLAQVLHDDFGRILLNNWANHLSAKLSRR